MTTPRLRGYRQHADEHPGAENYPASGARGAGASAGLAREYRGFGSSERSYPSEYTPDYKAELDANYAADGRPDWDADYDDYNRGSGDDFDGGDFDEYDESPDPRWKWVAAAAAIVLAVAVLITVMVTSGDDETQTAATSATPTAPRTVIATAPSEPTVPPAPSPTATLPPETVTTVTPAPEPVVAPPPVEEGAPPPAPAPGTITYTVTGNRQLFDLVSIIYTDEQGLPRTDVNVALPWTKTIVLNPGVTTMSVTATSVAGQLNCAITDAQGAVVVAQNNNLMISTCS